MREEDRGTHHSSGQQQKKASAQKPGSGMCVVRRLVPSVWCPEQRRLSQLRP